MRSITLWICAVLSVAPRYGFAQQPQNNPTLPVPGVKTGGSPNIHKVAHLPIRGFMQTVDIEIEQELSRPYVYLSRSRLLTNEAGFTVVSIKDPARASVIYTWQIENSELNDQGLGGVGAKYFKLRGRYYLVNGFQFGQNGPAAALGAVVFDITGLPDTTTIKEVRRIHVPEALNGFHNVYTYKHSDGRALLFATSITGVRIYDLEKTLAGDPKQGFIGFIPIPAGISPFEEYIPGYSRPILSQGYHDMYVGYDPGTHQDKFYGPGTGGFHVYDVTRPEEPRLITSVSGVAGMQRGHTFTPTPDGRYAVGESEYQYAPLRIFDLKPGLDGQVKTISRAIGAITGDWRAVLHNTEVRWPYVFTAGFEDGFSVFNMMDPTNPYFVGQYFTCECPHEYGWVGNRQAPRGQSVYNGAEAIDVRNADGLIVVSDLETGFWAFKMDGFDGWNGHQWGMPNISSAQDWDNGPEGAPKATKVS